MTAAELAEKLERLDALFVELYNYAESQSLSDTMSKSGANALRAIKGSIGNRYNVIPQAAARLRSMEEALKPFAEVARLEELHGSTLGHRDIPDKQISAVDFQNERGHLLSIRGPEMGDFRKARAALERI